jgi:hypothetical protein
MRIRGRSKESLEHLLARHYRWEFLRRNNNYRSDFDQFNREFGSWFSVKGSWYDRTVVYRGEDKQFYGNKIRRVLGRLEATWDVSQVLPYDWTFDSTAYTSSSLGHLSKFPTRFGANL